MQADASTQRHSRWLRKAGSYLLLTVGAIIVLVPIYFTIVNSLVRPDQLAHQPPPFYPSTPKWHNYVTAWNSGQLSRYLTNSAVMTAFIVAGQLVTSVLAAYAFAFLRFPFKRTLFLLCLATLMIPLEVTFITNLDTVSSLGWFNTYEGLAVPFLATGFGIFLLRQAFLQIPKDLQEAARLDGYGHWRFMTRVAVPPGAALSGRVGCLLLPGCLESIPLAPAVDRRHQTPRHRPDRAEATRRHPGRLDPRRSGRGRDRFRTPRHLAAGVPEATRPKPDRRCRQVSGPVV